MIRRRLANENGYVIERICDLEDKITKQEIEINYLKQEIITLKNNGEQYVSDYTGGKCEIKKYIAKEDIETGFVNVDGNGLVSNVYDINTKE